MKWFSAGGLVLCLLTALMVRGQNLPQTQWQQVYGTSASDYILDTAQLPDGGYVFVGATMGGVNPGTYDCWIERVDRLGNPVWNQTFGSSGHDYFMSVQPTSDGGCVAAGTIAAAGPIPVYPFYNANHTTSGDYLVMRYDATGSNIWLKSYGGTNGEELTAIVQTSDGGFLLGGSSRSGISGTKTTTNFGGSDYWIVRLDTNGNALWQNSFGGTNEYPTLAYSTGLAVGDYLTSAQETSDHGFILGGYSCSTGGTGNKSAANQGYFNYWVVRCDTNGTKLWDKTFGGAADDYLQCVRQTPDGGFILGGFSYSLHSGNKSATNLDARTEVVNEPPGSANLFTRTLTADYWLVRIDSNGNKLWDKAYGTTNDDWLISVEPTLDGGFVMGGFSGPSSSQHWLVIKVDTNGVVQWQQTYGNGPEEKIRRIRQTRDGGFLVAGYLSSQDALAKYGGYDGWLMKLSAEPPTLNFNADAAALNCTWPATAPMFLLESNSEVSATAGWVPVDAPATTNNGQKTISVPLDSTNLFFRLRQDTN